MPSLQDHQQVFKLLQVEWLLFTSVIEGIHSFWVLLHSFFGVRLLYLESILETFALYQANFRQFSTIIKPF